MPQEWSELHTINTTIPVIPCTPPQSGDWTITESCTLTDTVTAPADVVVPPNVTLTIAANAVLHIDFINQKLQVEPTGGVLIEPGGTIRQSP